MTASLIIGGCFAALLGIAILLPSERPRPTRRHTGVEMKARDGRLVHFRETESEREI